MLRFVPFEIHHWLGSRLTEGAAAVEEAENPQPCCMREQAQPAGGVGAWRALQAAAAAVGEGPFGRKETCCAAFPENSAACAQA